MTTPVYTADLVPSRVRILIRGLIIESGYSRTGRTVQMLETIRELVSTTTIKYDRDSAYSSSKTERWSVIDAAGEAFDLIVSIDGTPDGADIVVTRA